MLRQVRCAFGGVILKIHALIWYNNYPFSSMVLYDHRRHPGHLARMLKAAKLTVTS
jgi:hypothetical protein